MTGAELSAALRAALARELPAAVTLRHDLHAHAEPSGSEHRTSATVAAALGAAGAPVIGGTGRVVRIGPQAGPCVAVRTTRPVPPITGAPAAPCAADTVAAVRCSDPDSSGCACR